jgi:hypothetical protein
MRTRLTFAAATVVLGLAWNPALSQSGEIVGSWRGTSLCVDKEHYPACKDEQVIYDAVRKASSRDTVNLRADKVVNGVREFMGEFEFSRAPDSSWIAKYENPRVRLRIVLTISAEHMSGFMLDEISGRRVRKMALDRVH